MYLYDSILLYTSLYRHTARLRYTKHAPPAARPQVEYGKNMTAAAAALPPQHGAFIANCRAHVCMYGSYSLHACRHQMDNVRALAALFLPL